VSGHVAIVTGGAGGLGQAIAGRLREDGLTVVSADIQGADVHLDVTNPDSAQAMHDELAGADGQVDSTRG